MARTKAQQENVDKNKEIAEFVWYFYNNIVGIRPDTTHYSSGHKILDSLMNNPDPKIRSYTFAELSVVCAVLKAKGVVIKTLSLLFYPNLVASVVNGDKEVLEAIVDRLIKEQQSQGIYSKEAIERAMPCGW